MDEAVDDPGEGESNGDVEDVLGRGNSNTKTQIRTYGANARTDSHVAILGGGVLKKTERRIVAPKSLAGHLGTSTGLEPGWNLTADQHRGD